MISGAKLATLAAWTLIIINWLMPLGSYHSLIHWTGIGLAIAHLFEVAFFYRKACTAGGSLPLHLLQLFIFGYAHAMTLNKIPHDNA